MRVLRNLVMILLVIMLTTTRYGTGTNGHPRENMMMLDETTLVPTISANGDLDDEETNLRNCQLDIGFVLDGSGSVGIDNWNKMLQFVKDFASRLQSIGDTNHFGVVSFGNEATLNIRLDEVNSLYEFGLAVDNIRYKDENTNTASGMRTMRSELFDTTKGDRPQVQNIGIVLTDGASTRETERTIPEADYAREDGIMLFAVGIGTELNEQELQALANDPDEKFLFYVDDFEDLLANMDRILKASCRVVTQPPTSTTTTTTPAPFVPCPRTDIVFVVDSSGSLGHSNWRRVQNFLKDFVSYLTVGPLDTQVAAITYSSEAFLEFYLNQYTSVIALHEGIDRLRFHDQRTNTSGALHMVRDLILKQDNGDRPDAENLVLVITDGHSNLDAAKCLEESISLQRDGTMVYSIGVGNDVNMEELLQIASHPKYYYMNLMSDFRTMGENVDGLLRHTCAGLHPTPVRVQVDLQACGSDVVFILDDASATPEEFGMMMDIVYTTIDQLPFGQSLHKIGLVTTAGGANLVIAFNDFGYKEDILRMLGNVMQREGYGNLAEAVHFVMERMLHFNVEFYERQQYPNYLVLLTSGVSDDNADELRIETANAREQGTSVFLIDFDEVYDDESNMVGVPNDPREVFWIPATSATMMEDMVYGLVDKLCLVAARTEWSCTFEDEDSGQNKTCEITQEKNDDFDWILHKGATPSRHTGPERAKSGEYYMYIEASQPRRPGDTATLLLPTMYNLNGPCCLHFNYHMRGHHSGTLQVFAKDERSAKEEIRWIEHGPQGEDWKYGMATIMMDYRPKIGIRAIRGDAFSGDIAIDNLKMTRGPCPYGL